MLLLHQLRAVGSQEVSQVGDQGHRACLAGLGIGDHPAPLRAADVDDALLLVDVRPAQRRGLAPAQAGEGERCGEWVPFGLGRLHGFEQAA
jgi:hypothetical protein